MIAVRTGLVVAALCGVAAAEPPLGRLELGLRAGVHDTSLEFGDDAPKGKGPLIDASMGLRLDHVVSISLSLTYSTLHDSFIDPFVTGKHYDADVRIIDIGPRLSLHTHGLLAGFAVAGESVKQVIDGMTYRDGGTLIELHVGFTFPRIAAIGGGAIQILALGGIASTRVSGDTVENARLALGVEY